MSASIYFQPVKGKHLSIGAPSSFLAMFERAFGERPWTLMPYDMPKLEGMKAGTDQTEFQQALDVLLDAIAHHDEVRVWAEY